MNKTYAVELDRRLVETFLRLKRQFPEKDSEITPEEYLTNYLETSLQIEIEFALDCTDEIPF